MGQLWTIYGQVDSHGLCCGCRAKCKGQDPCEQGIDLNLCASCAALSEEQWTHLRENFAPRSTYRNCVVSQSDLFKEQGTEDVYW